MTDTSEEAGPALPGLSFVKVLGRGGFADVYLYEQDRPRMRVAVKVLRGEGLSEAVRERFAAEANAMAELADHPNIVQVFRSDATGDGRPYMVMKYYPQRNLAVRSRAEPIPVPDVLQIGVRIASAVETAHRAGVLHRDIKPANILTSQYGEPGLTDFGIATTVEQDSQEEADGMSIPWSPPEILFGRSQGGLLSDVYSLGATLWHLLAGRSPFEEPNGDNSTVALMRRIKEQAPPRTGRQDVPASLERVLAQAMAKDPADRHQSALDLARSLQAVEREQMMAPTPLIILNDEEPPPADEPTPDGNPATRLKRPREVSPQGPADDPATRRKRPHQVSSHAPSENGPTRASPRLPRARQGIGVEGEAGGTVPRAVGVETGASPETQAASEVKRKPVWLLAGVAVLAVGLVVGIGVALSGNSNSGRPSSTAQTGPQPTAPVQVGDTPVVRATPIDSNHVSYTWTDPGAQPGDTFAVSISGAPPRIYGPNTPLVLTQSAGTPKCIAVEIVRHGAYGPPGGNC